MKLIGIITSFTCLSHAALAIDEATPSPSPVYLSRLARPGTLRRHGQIEHRQALEARAESKAQAKSDRRSQANTQAQARAATRAREQAQRQVAAEARHETATAEPHPTSDLMQRMCFNEAEIAAQKAREQLATSGGKDTPNAAAAAGTGQPQPKPATVTQAAGEHPAPSASPAP